MQDERDRQYLELILTRLRICLNYQPKLGQGKSVSLQEFLDLYSADLFYAWFGLNNSLMYAAHKAAGGITSIYRQIGIGCEALFRQLLVDQLGLTLAQATWSYTVGLQDRTLELDGRITSTDIQFPDKQVRFANWLQGSAQRLGVDEGIQQALKGCVFEVRQGYKSKDSKRQNADIANGIAAYKAGYLPAILLLSTQIDDDLAHRYLLSGLLILKGWNIGSPYESTYVFCREVLGYDLAAFFERNSDVLRQEIQAIVKALLTA